MQTTESWPIALANYIGKLENHYPPRRLIDSGNRQEFIFPKNILSEPIPNAITVFTYGSSTGIAADAGNDEVTSFQTGASFAQITELPDVVAAFTAFPDQPLMTVPILPVQYHFCKL